jgi:hypothetical protein
MAPDAQSFLVPFLVRYQWVNGFRCLRHLLTLLPIFCKGALQASIAVLLTIFAGVIAAQFRLLSESASKEISQVGVNLFLPALLITNIGSQVSTESVGYMRPFRANSVPDVDPDTTLYTHHRMGANLWHSVNAAGHGNYPHLQDTIMGNSSHSLQ